MVILGEGDDLGVLGLVLVGVAGIDVQFAEDLATEAVVGDHAPDGVFDQQFGVAAPDGGDIFGLLPTDIAAETGVGFVFLLASGEADFAGVDDDDEVAAIDVGAENGFVFAAEQTGGGNGDFTENLVFGVDDIPLTVDFLRFGCVCFHV